MVMVIILRTRRGCQYTRNNIIYIGRRTRATSLAIECGCVEQTARPVCERMIESFERAIGCYNIIYPHGIMKE